MAPDARVHLFHIGTPTCWWTYGYLGVLERVRLVYGQQVAIHTYVGCVYDDKARWLEHEELTDETNREWQVESAELMGVPMAPHVRLDEMPDSLQPVTDATWAAFRQGHDKGERFMREVLRALLAKQRAPGNEAAWDEAAGAAGLDLDAFHADIANADALDEVASEMGRGFPHVGLAFYNLAVGNGDDTWVVLNHAFDPARVERAIEFIADGGLTRSEPTDVVAYLERNGACSAAELSKAFGTTAEEMEARLTKLEKDGSVRPVALAAGTFWESR